MMPPSSTARPALQALYRDTFAKNKLDAIAFPTVPKVAIASNADSSSLANFLLFIQNTDPGSNAGVPGIQLPVALGASSKLPVGLELDGPSGSDRQAARDRHGAGEGVRTAAAAVALTRAHSALMPASWITLRQRASSPAK